MKSKPLRILMFGWEFPPFISGGLGTACYGLSKSLAELGVEVTFVLPKIKGRPDRLNINLVGAENILFEEFHQKQGISKKLIKFLEINSSLRPYFTAKDYEEFLFYEKVEMLQKTGNASQLFNFSGDYGKNLNEEVERFSKICSYLAYTEEFDLIHVHDWMTFPAGIAVQKLSGKPLIAHVHATEFDRTGDNVNPHVYSIEKLGLECANRVITVSHRTKNLVIEKYHIDPAKIDVVHNAVSREDIGSYTLESPFDQDYMVLFLGRVTMQKGPDYFVEAADRVIKKFPNARFIMAGTGDMLKRMIERVAQLRIADRFHFTGFVNEKDREKVFSLTDLFVMPSVSEPFGITPLEAMCHNIPVIISRQSGVSEILEHAIKVDFWDVEQLANAIINVLTEKNKRGADSFDHSKVLDQITWGNSALRVQDVYYRILTERTVAL